MNTSSSIQLPEEFRATFVRSFGQEELASLERALSAESPASVRFNPHKVTLLPNAQVVPWCGTGIYLSERPLYGADPWWYAGAYYVQEPASMFVVQYLAQYQLAPEVTIDISAAPGGKSTLLRSYLPPSCVLIANEPITSRAKILRENFIRYGSEEVIVTSAYPEALCQAGLFADLILVDAPCSGEGMFRKEPVSLTEWQHSALPSIQKRQLGIIREAWQMLQPEGVLIYSTCTYNELENEDVLLWLLNEYDAEVLPLRLDNTWGVIEGKQSGVYRFFPHRTQSEGLTIFAVRKRGNGHPQRWYLPKQRKEKSPADLAALSSEYLTHDSKDTWSYLSVLGRSIVERLHKGNISTLLAGVELGTAHRADFVPAHTWATSGTLAEAMPYPTHEVTKAEALEFLKRGSLHLHAPQGYLLLTYEQVPIGLVKNLGTRANNLYPKELALKNKNIGEAQIPHHHFAISNNKK